jgi:hypothetical protein
MPQQCSLAYPFGRSDLSTLQPYFHTVPSCYRWFFANLIKFAVRINYAHYAHTCFTLFLGSFFLKNHCTNRSVE